MNLRDDCPHLLSTLQRLREKSRNAMTHVWLWSSKAGESFSDQTVIAPCKKAVDNTANAGLCEGNPEDGAEDPPIGVAEDPSKGVLQDLSHHVPQPSIAFTDFPVYDPEAMRKHKELEREFVDRKNRASEMASEGLAQQNHESEAKRIKLAGEKRRNEDERKLEEQRKEDQLESEIRQVDATRVSKIEQDATALESERHAAHHKLAAQLGFQSYQ